MRISPFAASTGPSQVARGFATTSWADMEPPAISERPNSASWHGKAQAFSPSASARAVHLSRREDESGWEPESWARPDRQTTTTPSQMRHVVAIAVALRQSPSILHCCSYRAYRGCCTAHTHTACSSELITNTHNTPGGGVGALVGARSEKTQKDNLVFSWNLLILVVGHSNFFLTDGKQLRRGGEQGSRREMASVHVSEGGDSQVPIRLHLPPRLSDV